MYIDTHSIMVIGNKHNDKTNKQEKKKILATHNSEEGMDIKKFISFLEEFADSHECHNKIHISVKMNQPNYD